MMERSPASTLSRIISLGAEMLSRQFNPFDSKENTLNLDHGVGTGVGRRSRLRMTKRKGTTGYRSHKVNPAGSKPAGRMLARHG